MRLKIFYRLLIFHITFSSIDVVYDQDILKYSMNIPHHSVDSVIEHANKRSIHPVAMRSNVDHQQTEYTLMDQQRRDVLHKAEDQFRSLMISSSTGQSPYHRSTYNPNMQQHHDYQNLTFPSQQDHVQHQQPPLSSSRQSIESTDSRSSRVYNLERASKNFSNEMAHK